MRSGSAKLLPSEAAQPAQEWADEEADPGPRSGPTKLLCPEQAEEELDENWADDVPSEAVQPDQAWADVKWPSEAAVPDQEWADDVPSEAAQPSQAWADEEWLSEAAVPDQAWEDDEHQWVDGEGLPCVVELPDKEEWAEEEDNKEADDTVAYAESEGEEEEEEVVLHFDLNEQWLLDWEEAGRAFSTSRSNTNEFSVACASRSNTNEFCIACASRSQTNKFCIA